MNNKSKYSTWETAFLVMAVLPAFLGHGHAIDAAHARHAALFRLVMAVGGVIGWIIIQVVKRGSSSETPPAPIHTTPDGTATWDAPPADAGPQFSVTYSSTRSDQWRCNQFMICHRPQALVLIYLFPILGSILYALPQVGLHPVQALVTVVALFLAWTIVMVLVLYAQIRQRLPRPDSVRYCTTILRPDGFTDRTPDKVTHLSWSAVKGVQEQDGDFYIWRGAVDGSFVPRTAFPDRATALEFARTAEALWKSRPVQWPATQVIGPPQPTADSTVWPPPPRIPS